MAVISEDTSFGSNIILPFSNRNAQPSEAYDLEKMADAIEDLFGYRVVPFNSLPRLPSVLAKTQW
jgi:hypothetical protein